MATFLDGLLSDARWYAYSILLSVALLSDSYLISHSPVSGLGVLGIVVLSSLMAGGILLLLRSLRSKKPKDPGGQPGEFGSLHFRAAAGKKSK